MIIEMYKKNLTPAYKVAKGLIIKTGVAFGVTQFAQYLVFATMFYSGGWIIKDSYDEETKTYGIDPTDLFIALFAIMFGASHAGSSQAFGPDMGKAMGAAKRIFAIMEYPSQIDACAIDNDKSKISLDPETVKGEIKFENVWFRYPTRKEDFVLRGLTITINPNESVALVGESGCGKSTFVNLMMRFYDVDHGRILLDGKNIKDINLHDLRKAISLVMQEPIIFNYTILDNILYGKPEATNSEIQDACKIANCNEFIERQDLFVQDESAQALHKEMEKNKELLLEIIDEKKYEEELEILKDIMR